jgi:hypothetical protein
MSILSANAQNSMVQFLGDYSANAFYTARPFFDRIKKLSNKGGESAKVPVATSPGGGSGGGYSQAAAAQQSDGAKRVAFIVEPAVGFGLEKIDQVSRPYSDTPESAVDFLLDGTKNAMYMAAQNLESMIFADGYGTLFTAASATNDSGHLWTITLTKPTDVFKINLGMILVSKTSGNAAALDTGSGEVVAVNQSVGTVQLDVSTSGMVPTAGHVFGQSGTMQASTAIITWPGIYAWNPTVLNRGAGGYVGDTFLGVDRTTGNAVLTSGFATDGRNAGSIVSAINNLCGLMANLKVKPDIGICNPTTLAQVANELDTKSRYDSVKSFNGVDVLYDGVTIMTPAGKIILFPESAADPNVITVCRADGFTFAYPDKIFKPLNIDGTVGTVDPNSTNLLLRVTASGFFYCTDLSQVGNVLIA